METTKDTPTIVESEELIDGGTNFESRKEEIELKANTEQIAEEDNNLAQNGSTHDFNEDMEGGEEGDEGGEEGDEGDEEGDKGGEKGNEGGEEGDEGGDRV